MGTFEDYINSLRNSIWNLYYSDLITIDEFNKLSLRFEQLIKEKADKTTKVLQTIKTDKEK